jgi:hypothetical protein
MPYFCPGQEPLAYTEYLKQGSDEYGAELAGVFCLFVFAVLAFELRAYALSHSTSPFFEKGFFEIESYGTIFLVWLSPEILLISDS